MLKKSLLVFALVATASEAQALSCPTWQGTKDVASNLYNKHKKTGAITAAVVAGLVVLDFAASKFGLKTFGECESKTEKGLSVSFRAGSNALKGAKGLANKLFAKKGVEAANAVSSAVTPGETPGETPSANPASTTAGAPTEVSGANTPAPTNATV